MDGLRHSFVRYSRSTADSEGKDTARVMVCDGERLARLPLLLEEFAPRVVGDRLDDMNAGGGDVWTERGADCGIRETVLRNSPLISSTSSSCKGGCWCPEQYRLEWEVRRC